MEHTSGTEEALEHTSETEEDYEKVSVLLTETFPDSIKKIFADRQASSLCRWNKKNELVLDLSGTDENWLQRVSNQVFGDISQQPIARQFGIGSVSGIVAGWLFVKVGKVAAATIGTTVLLVQVAQHQGYIEINWDRMRSDMHKAEREVQRRARMRSSNTDLINSFRDFVKENLFLAVGFGGGFLIALALLKR